MTTNKTRTINRNSPVFLGQTPLEFDSVSAEELMDLTPQEKMDFFMSRWMEKMRPFHTYKTRMEDPILGGGRALRLIKQYYRKYVIEQDWSELKYVVVIDSILITFDTLSAPLVEKRGTLYDQGKLDIQQKLAKQKSGRRKRI